MKTWNVLYITHFKEKTYYFKIYSMALSSVQKAYLCMHYTYKNIHRAMHICASMDEAT